MIDIEIQEDSMKTVGWMMCLLVGVMALIVSGAGLAEEGEGKTLLPYFFVEGGGLVLMIFLDRKNL
jgi:hypothetical protein